LGSIPLPALDIKPAQPVDALSEYAKVVSLRSMMQQQQLQQQEIQQKNQALTDQHALTTAMTSWDGKDPNDLVQSTLKNGGSATAAIGLQQHFLQTKQTAATIAKDDAETGKNNLETTINRHNQILGHLSTLDNVKDEDLPSHVTDTVEQMGKDGTITDPNELNQYRQGAAQIANLAQQNPPAARQALQVMEKRLLGEKEQFQQAQEERKTAAEETTAKTKQAEVALQTQRLAAEMPGGPLASPEKQQQDYFMKNPPPGYRGTPLDFLTYKSKLAPLAQISIANAAGGGLTDEATDQAAEMYHMTGKLPPAARGVAGLVQNRKIMNRSAELYPGSITEGSAEYAANKKTLMDLQPKMAAINAFESTAKKNLQMFLDQAENMTDTGVKFLNVPIRKIQSGVLGTSDMAAVTTARTVAMNEIAKVLSNPGMSGVLTDSAKTEAQGLIGGDFTLNSIKKAANVLIKDMDNRHDSYQQQIDDIKKQLGANAAPAGKETPTATTPTPESNKGDFFSQFGGKPRTKPE
jgi:hypothetical protein